MNTPPPEPDRTPSLTPLGKAYARLRRAERSGDPEEYRAALEHLTAELIKAGFRRHD